MMKGVIVRSCHSHKKERNGQSLPTPQCLEVEAAIRLLRPEIVHRGVIMAAVWGRSVMTRTGAKQTSQAGFAEVQAHCEDTQEVEDWIERQAKRRPAKAAIGGPDVHTQQCL